MKPFAAAVYAGRIAEAARAAGEAGLGGVLITPGPDLAYFTGYAPTALTERLTLLAIRADGVADMVVPVLERPDVVRASRADLEIVTWTDGEDEFATAARLLDPAGRYAISDNAWALHALGLQRALPAATLTAMTDALPMLRAVKDAAEIERLAAAGAADDAAFADVLGVRFAGRREREVAADLADLIRAHGHETADFTIVGSGPNGANPHHDSGDRVIEEGDLVVLDFGGLRDGYGSDMTRTVHVGADVTPREREVHDVVRAAQQAGVDAVRPGATCQDVDRAARAVITDAGFGEHFIHRTGHGIGMTVHEPPYMVEGETTPIVAGMCFSVEPGIYLPGQFGVRIEDIVAAFPDGEPGARRLNNAPREIRIVQ